MVRAHHEGLDKPDEVKQCPRCKESFPLTQENFYVRRNDGNLHFTSYCISCQKAHARQAYHGVQTELVDLRITLADLTEDL